jgi:hypothetical protein
LKRVVGGAIPDHFNLSARQLYLRCDLRLGPTVLSEGCRDVQPRVEPGPQHKPYTSALYIYTIHIILLKRAPTAQIG